ncbi:hypothetical protein [Nostoc parmelioides]|uniref:Uncharacterized protein n=1 Tax=Nostoc parmelioides FACHB-3921 TaxID=2692909 RepID=A0ABR8BN95_9NOSO|nr:hypothetical protein [Nostoc parmelioides]MBD2254707.1 hypothetical protein [Nostoc parmelioides FACHB-3921]
MTSKKNEQNHLSVPFHRLTEEEVRQWYQDKLIATTGYILAIRKIKAPPGKPFVISNVVKFCEDWGIARSAFYRAVDYLKDKGYFTWEATHGIILSDSKKVISFPTEKNCPACGTQSHERDSQSHERDSQSHERDSQSHKRDTKSSQSLQCNDSSNAQIYSDKSDIQTLSDLKQQERESFEKFVREEYKKTEGKEIRTTFAAFMRGNHFQEWYQKYQNRPETLRSTQNEKWTNHPQRDEWIEQIHHGKPRFIAQGGPKEERETRRQFAEWAEANNLVWGMET